MNGLSIIYEFSLLWLKSRAKSGFPLRLSFVAFPRPFLIASQSYRAFADLRAMTDGPTRRDKGLDYAAIRLCEMAEDVTTGAGERRARGDERWIRGLSCGV